jgi:hypothetical protein
VWDQVGGQVGDQVWRAGYGSHDSGWISFYKFFREEVNLKEETEKLIPLMNLAEQSGWWWPFENLVIITEKPKIVSIVNRRLHKDNGPAIEYSDGFSVYALNGIRMKQEYVMTPANELSVSTIMKEQDVDIRRELLKKVGLQRFIKETKGKILDSMKFTVNNKQIQYDLIKVQLGNNIEGLVLKMDNPSIDEIHVEGVEDTCKTVKDALAWRNGFDKYIEPITLT